MKSTSNPYWTWWQIRDQETFIIKLKRTRNPSLNLSRMPAEILGEIFRWNTVSRGTSGALEKHHTTSCSCAITGLRLLQALRSSGASGATTWKTGRNTTFDTQRSRSTSVCEMRSRIVPRETPSGVSTSLPLIRGFWTLYFPNCAPTVTGFDLAVWSLSLQGIETVTRHSMCRVTSPATTSQNCDASSFKTAR